MRKLFYYLLKKYSTLEKDRAYIIQYLEQKVCSEYTEQTFNGNFYILFIEYYISNDWLQERVEKNDNISLHQLRTLVNSAFADSIDIIKNEKIKH